jgi:hypothetical protein
VAWRMRLEMPQPWLGPRAKIFRTIRSRVLRPRFARGCEGETGTRSWTFRPARPALRQPLLRPHRDQRVETSGAPTGQNAGEQTDEVQTGTADDEGGDVQAPDAEQQVLDQPREADG